MANKIKVDTRELHVMTARVQRDLNNIGSTMRKVTRYQEEQTRQNFEQERSPDGSPWQEVTPQTRARKGSNKILHESGDLEEATEVIVEDLRASLVNDLIYASTHQYGDPSRNIPQREFMGFSPQDEEAIAEIMREDIKKILKRYR